MNIRYIILAALVLFAVCATACVMCMSRIRASELRQTNSIDALELQRKQDRCEHIYAYAGKSHGFISHGETTIFGIVCHRKARFKCTMCSHIIQRDLTEEELQATYLLRVNHPFTGKAE